TPRREPPTDGPESCSTSSVSWRCSPCRESPRRGAPSMTTSRDLALTLAGGGNRSFYQLGLLERWGEALFPRLGAMATCSAGACVATLWLSGRDAEARALWLRRRESVRKNFDWSLLLRGRNPAPHGPIYRDTLLEAY